MHIGEGKKFTPLFLHHAALFAATRWTNLYFPAILGPFGDFVGGRLRPMFGDEIRDVKVRTQLWGGLANFTLLVESLFAPAFRPACEAEKKESEA